MHQQQPSPRVLLLVTNPGAGGSDEATLARLSRVWEQAGVRVHRHRLRPQEQGVDPTLGPALRRCDADRVVVAGGDGTVHATVASLHRQGPAVLAARPIAIVPLGTGNDLAGGLGLPADPERAALAALQPRLRPMDLLVDDHGLVAVNAVHVGVGALATERGTAFKPTLGPLGYAVGAALAGATATGWPMSVTVDGTPVTRPGQTLLMLGLALGPTIGGGTPLAPAARPDDGLVDVVLVGATGLLARADFARRLRRADHLDRDDVALLRGTEVRLDAADAPLNVDGEVLGATGSRRFEVRPQAWTAVAGEDGA